MKLVSLNPELLLISTSLYLVLGLNHNSSMSKVESTNALTVQNSSTGRRYSSLV